MRNLLGSDYRPAHPDEIADRIGPPGFIGPVGNDVPVLLDEGVSVDGGGYVAGANRIDEHLQGVLPGRDFQFEPVDVRTVVAGDFVDGHALRIEPAIEVGNIFKLGTRYSLPLGRAISTGTGRAADVDGLLRLRPARAVAAAIEQFADDRGISWPSAIAPFDVHLVTLGKPGSEEYELSERLYDELLAQGLEVLYDDRDAGPGEKFADAELLGCPLRVTVGRRTLAAGELEVQVRRGLQDRTVPLAGAAEAVAALCRGLP